MNYRVIEKKDPRALEQPGKYYARLVSTSQVDIEDIATRITSTCTVTRHDCLAVLSALQEQVIYALQEGKRVTLGDLGTFHTTVSGSGSDTPEEYDISHIKRLRVIFQPNMNLRNALSLQNKAISFNRIQYVENKKQQDTAQD